MILTSPQFLLLLPMWLLLAWKIPQLGLWRPLRAGLFLALTLLLCDPRIHTKSGDMDLWVLFDRSLSAEEMVAPGMAEWSSILEKSRPGGDHHLRFIDYAADTMEMEAEARSEATFLGDRSRTNTAMALHEVLARMDTRRHNRILLFSDGYSTEPLTGLAAKLSAAGVSLDYRLLRAPRTVDYRIGSIDMPDHARIGEPFPIDIHILGDSDGSVPVELYRGDSRLFSETVTVKSGEGFLRLSDRSPIPGSLRYRVEIHPETDRYSGNNQRERWIEISSGPRVLLITAYPDDPLAKSLQSQGLEVVIVNDPLTVGVGALTGTKAVILNNVPVHQFSSSFLDALPFYVSDQGGGLLMVGGKNSFGLGGYAESVVDPLLPVSMELKNEHRKLAVAMVIVMDRSGSMAVVTPSGHTKMQLANEGAARSVELLGEFDAVSVFAVDTTPHQVAPLLNVGRNRAELVSRIRRIESMGGGIYVYEGLKAAWNVLKESPLGLRHVILFSDASDSEEPGDYVNLIKEMRAGGVTISVIGMGTRGDSDAKLLEDIAEKGGGRIFFSDNPNDLPNIFAQETVTVSRSSFITETTGTKTTGRWQALAPRDENWMKQIDGYNLNYLREGDEGALLTTDEYDAPLIAFGRRGIGRTAAVTFPLGGDFSALARQWPRYGDFAQTLTRWTMGSEFPTGVSVRHRLIGSQWMLDLYYDPATWESRLAETPPQLVLQSGLQNGKRSEPSWERVAPGHYSVALPLADGTPVRAALQMGDSAVALGPVVAGSDREWEFDPARITELKDTARASGGEELLDLNKAWRASPVSGLQPIRRPLVISLFGLLLLDALATQTGWNFPQLRIPQWIARRRIGKRRSRRSRFLRSESPRESIARNSSEATNQPDAVPNEKKPEEQTPESSAAEARKSRFRRAKGGH